MRKNTLNKTAFLLCVLVFLGCKSKKHLVASQTPDSSAVVMTDSAASTGVNGTDVKAGAINASTATSVSTVVSGPPVAATKAPVDNFKLEKLKAILLKQTDFSTFTGKAPTKLSVDGDSHDVTLNIRIKKNQQIWILITAVLGVEVARVSITPDSIKMMNKLQSTYLKQPFNFIYKYTSKNINYKTLESLLIGNAVPELVNDGTGLKPDNGNLILSGALQDLVYQLTVNSDLRVSQTNMSNPVAGQSLQVSNSVFVQAGTRVVPSKVNISSTSGAKKIIAEMHYTKADFDQEVSFPFNIPARYSMMK